MYILYVCMCVCVLRACGRTCVCYVCVCNEHLLNGFVLIVIVSEQTYFSCRIKSYYTCPVF